MLTRDNKSSAVADMDDRLATT